MSVVFNRFAHRPVLVFWVVLALCVVPSKADHPSYDFEVELGPGNEDAQKQIEKLAVHAIDDPLASKPGPDLSNRDFRRAVIHLQGRGLHRANFDGTDFTGADLEEYAFWNCSFRKAKLRGLELRVVEDNCDLTDADISGSRVTLTAQQLQSTKNYKEKDLSDTMLEGDFSGISFAGFDLRNTNFSSCGLARCDFHDADITRASFSKAFSKEQLYSTKNYKQKDLDRVAFFGCNFRKADFAGYNLGYFADCDLRDADLTGAEFPGRTTSEGPKRSFFRDPAYGFTRCKMTAEQFYSTRAYKTGRLPFDFALTEMNLDGWDFSKMDLSYVRMSSLKGANLSDARNGDFSVSSDLTVEQVKSMWNYKNDRLTKGMYRDGHYEFRLPDVIERVVRAEKDAERAGKPRAEK